MNESMWSKLRRWWNERKRVKAMKRRDAGYKFAMRMLTQELMTCQQLWDKTDESYVCGHFDDYDRGIRSALYDWDLRAVDMV